MAVDKNSNPHNEPIDDVKSVAPSNDEYDDNFGGVDLENLPENFIAPEVWEQIGKALDDFNFDDMKKLSFASMKMCVTFYYMYAKAKGFGARNKAAVRSKLDGKFTSKNLMCNREGARQLKYLENPNRKRPSRPETRCGCQAVIKFKWNPSDDSWFVRDFVGVHDHDPVSPSEVRFIRSHRSLSDADKLRIKALINSGVSPAVTMRNLVQQACGPHKLPFLKKDLQSIIFVVSLVSHEKEETFKWILEQLTEAGDNVAPHTVLTDGDKAMPNAISVVFPKAVHRLCLWHLMRNIKAHSSKTFCSGFMKCVDRCRTPTEFEQAWKELITTYGYEKEVWAQELYNDKGKWAECFMHGHFFVGMRSTQRCESMNSSLKTVFNKKIMLYKFVELYDQVLKDIRFTESGLDYQTKHTTPIIKGVLSGVKTHVVTVYTRNSYDMLYKEMNYESSHLVVKFRQDKTHLDGVTNIYWLSNTKFRKAHYVLIHIAKLHKMYCCCMKLEPVGIPCRHMFAVMKYARMNEIPRGCILRRWMKYAKTCLYYGHTLDEFKEQTDTAMVGRFAYLNGLGIQICRLAATSYKGSLWLKNVFSKVLISLETHDEKAEVIPKKETLVGIGDPKVLQAGRGLKKKATKPQEKSNSPEKPKSIDLNQSPPTTPAATSNIGLCDPSILLGDLMPGTYTSGEASEAVDSYEVSQYKTEPKVFDWGPRQQG
ncbi:protein FAR1-RELATED SEQUENCE 5-like [Spinacia oleracea]|uniref:Protein FAR1-RELATED SEQUENCE 5-like n=1 Tax=Spinacia oleracea TaxID=3562 RepID=A0ABM3RIX0_SPIOL|nr:protein FAR1-RELATED SEQUENCE 5-like [Spinacia oleracea]